MRRIELDIKFLAWHEDRWDSRNGSLLIYDKLEHFLRDYALAFIFGPVPAFLFALYHEWIDGTRPWALGSEIEGWSWKDLIAGWFGIALAILMRKLV